MPRWPDPEDELDDDFPEDDEDEDEATIPCPHCGEEIHEDSQRCPHCGQYISREDSPPQRKPWWIILGVVACLYVVLKWMWFI